VTLHPKLKELFHEFNRVGASWCVLRLPSGPRNSDGDVDLLVEPTDLKLIWTVLTKLDFVRLPGWEPGFHFLSYHSPTDRWLWLDIVTELSFGPGYVFRTGAEAGCLSRRQREGPIVTLAPDDRFWVLLLHCLLDKRSFPLRHRTHLQELASLASKNCSLAQTVARACPDHWDPARLVQYASDGSWIQLEGFARLLALTWMQRRQIGSRPTFLHRVMRLRDRLLSLPRRRGLGIALLGPDGAGKSTLIAALQESFILPVRSVYMGLTGGLLPFIDRLRLPVLVVPGRLFILWFRYLLAKYHQARGRLVLFDRYIYDSTVPTPYLLSRLQRMYRWIDGHACPAPDLVLVLDAPGQVMYQRKGEYTAEQLEDWRQHFLALQQRIPQLEIVDTTRDRDAVRIDVIDRIWRRYVARWRKN
jgi:thymidylate kinase